MKINKKWIVAISIILILIACSGYLGWRVAKSDKQTFNDLTIEELNKLSKEEQDKLIKAQPINDLFIKFAHDGIKNKENYKEIIKELITFEIGNNLYTLKFYNQLPTGRETSEFIEAVKMFQESIGHDKTGFITTEESIILAENVKKISFQKILLAGDPKNIYRYKSTWYNTASVTGTWILEGGNIASPINAVEIECDKERGLCKETRAVLYDLDYNTNLWLFPKSYNITKWDNHEIIAETYTKCRELTLTINSDLKEVYLIERNYGKKDCVSGGVKIPLLEKPNIFKLVDGYDLAKRYYEQKEKDNLKLYNPAYQKIVNEMVAKAK